MTEGSDGPWVAVSPATEELLDDLSAQCKALVGAWSTLGRRLGVHADPNAPVSCDALFLAAAVDAPAGLARAPGHYSGQYVDAIGQQLQAIAALLDARQVTVALWPLVRAELELAGRVGWLLDPGMDDVPLNAMQRVARFLIEGVGSLYRAKYTAGRTGSSRLEKHLKRQRDQMQADLELLFPDADLPMKTPEDIKRWVVGDQRSAPLTKAAEAFARCWLGDARGLYDAVSDYSHPSPYHLGTQTTYADLADRLEFRYMVTPERLEWQVKLGCLVLYRAAHLVVWYFGADDQVLEEWAEGCAEQFPSWFDAPAPAAGSD